MSDPIRYLLYLAFALTATTTGAQSDDSDPLDSASPEAHPLQTEYVQLLEHTSLIALEAGLPTAMIEEIESARLRSLELPPEMFEALEPYAGDMIRELETSAETRAARIIGGEGPRASGSVEKRADYAPLSLPPSNSRPFPGRDHFDLDWSFETDTPGDTPGDGSTDGREESGRCRSPGPSNKELIDAKRDEIISFSVKVVAERFCEQTVAGINLSVACIPTDIVYYAFHAISESEQMCSSLMGRTYVDAVFDGSEYIHERLGDIDGSVKTEIRNAASRVISKINLTRDRIVNEKLAELRDATSTSIQESGEGLESAIQQTEARLLARIDALNQAVVDESNATTSSLLVQINDRSDAIDSELLRTQNLIEDFERENRQILIEANLAEQGRPVNGFGPIAAFQSASLMTEVTAIVRQTIDRFMAAGEDVGNAESQFFTASSMLSAGDYEAAYKWLGMAYQSATQ